MGVDCDDGKWMELAYGRVQWRALISGYIPPEELTSYIKFHCTLTDKSGVVRC